MGADDRSTSPPESLLSAQNERPFLCGGCNVREPWEHRCHRPDGPCPCDDCESRSCECAECRETP